MAAKIWYHNLSYENGTDTKRDEIGFLDYQVLQWYQQIPESLKFNSKDLARENEISSRGLRRLRFLMYLRANQARISIYRPIMHSATSIMEHRVYAQTAIDVAKDTISALTRVNRASDIYTTQQVAYHYFLVQALAVIFLAVSHAPATFCQQTREEFYAAIELVRGLSTKSYISKRLWRTIRGLKELGERIGLLSRGGHGGNGTEEAEAEAHSNAAVAMAGLAGHPMDDLTLYSSNVSNSVSDLTYTSPDGQQISNELTSLFELAGGYGNLITGLGADKMGGYIGSNGELQGGGEGVSSMFGNEQEFSKIMGEIF